MNNLASQMRWVRHSLGLNQKKFAEEIGVCQLTISKLERDRTAWATIMPSTVDKIHAYYESLAKKKPNDDEIREIINDLRGGFDEQTSEPVVEEVVTVEPEPVVIIEEPVVHNDSDLTDKDRQLMKYVEFACGNLRESKSHEEFVTQIDILKRIIKNQY